MDSSSGSGLSRGGLCRFPGSAVGHRQLYPSLDKSALTAPDIVFPIAWSILYVCMGVSVGLIGNTRASDRGFLLGLFSVQLILNFLWSFLFFTLQHPVLGFIDIVWLDFFVILYIVKSYSRHRVSVILFMPYAVWILFATYLTFYVMTHN